MAKKDKSQETTQAAQGATPAPPSPPAPPAPEAGGESASPPEESASGKAKGKSNPHVVRLKAAKEVHAGAAKRLADLEKAAHGKKGLEARNADKAIQRAKLIVTNTKKRLEEIQAEHDGFGK